MVYRYDPKQNLFTKFQSLTTIGAYDLQPFSYDGDLYLAAAFRFDGKSGTLKSKIYKMYYGCVDKENVLPWNKIERVFWNVCFSFIQFDIYL